jgi:hypothetical protein
MNSVIMIAYGFPPEGNAGVYRPLRFVRQLSKMGWKPKVISALPIQYERYDPELLAMVPSQTEVVRVKGYDLWQAFQGWRSRRNQERHISIPGVTGRILHNGRHGNVRSWMRGLVRVTEAWCYHPDMAAPWIRSAVDATARVCERDEVRVIWATAGPVASFYVAQAASQKTGIPYVLDFRDSWTISYNEFESRRPAWAIRRDRTGMFQLLQGAQAVIFRYATEAECYWRAYRKALEPLKVHVIPNGYEGRIEEFAAPVGNRCKIVYTGTLASYRYDTLLKSLSILKETDPSRANKLQLLFVGEGTDVLGPEIKGLGLSGIVETRGPTSHGEIARLHREAHGFLVLGRTATMRGHELLVGAKLFAYLKAGRPIIGVLPSDETKNILQHLGVRTIADAESCCQIIAVLRQVLDAWSTGTLSVLVPDQKACEAYSVERQTAALINALEHRPAADPFVPGAVDIPQSLRGYIGKAGWLS